MTIERAAQEGRDAADAGKTFGQDCPYTYCNLSGDELRNFNRVWRPLMNAWFGAWDRRMKELETTP